MIHHKIRAGTHLVELIDPKTSETVKKTTVIVEDGGTAKVAE